MRSKLVRILLIASISLNLALVIGSLVFISKKGGLPYIERKINELAGNGAKEGISPYYSNRNSLFELLHTDVNGVYFVGDSITNLCEWHEVLNMANVRNRGISGDTTSGILNRIDNVVNNSPSKVFLMCGINDIQGRVPMDDSLKNISAIIAKISLKAPKSRVFIMSVLPVNVRKYKQYTMPDHLGIHMPEANEVKALNESVSKIVSNLNNDNISYLDLYKLRNDKYELLEDYTYDGIHLNGKGMIEWAATIRGLALSDN